MARAGRLYPSTDPGKQDHLIGRGVLFRCRERLVEQIRVNGSNPCPDDLALTRIPTGLTSGVARQSWLQWRTGEESTLAAGSLAITSLCAASLRAGIPARALRCGEAQLQRG